LSIINESDHVVGLDPDRKDLFVAIYGDEKKFFQKNAQPKNGIHRRDSLELEKEKKFGLKIII